MNTRIICRFGSQAALDEFNQRNGFDINPLTKEYDVHTKKRVDKKKVKAKKEDPERDWWKAHYWQLPMYESHDDEPYAKVDMVFSENDLDYANQVFNQSVTEKTLSLWYPKLIPGWHSPLRVIGGSSEHRYPIYVISKGRWDKCYTSRFLTQMEVKHFVVCEPQEYAQYKANVENQYATLLQLDMTYKDRYDTCDNMDPSFPKGSGPARNFCWDDSIKRGYKWHWLMDDNALEGFHYRWHNAKIKCRTGAILASCEDFVDRYENIGMFGPNYSGFCHLDSYRPPFTVNTRVYSCILIRNDVCDKDGNPFRWRARFNEDTDLSLRVLKAGWCTVLANWCLFGKATTMKVKGGNTDSIYVDGTKAKSEMIANLHPDVAKVVWKFHRWHHDVDYSVFKQELKYKPGIVPVPGDNNYGMRVVKTEETNTFDTKAYLEEKYGKNPDYVYGAECSNSTMDGVQSAPVQKDTITTKTLIDEKVTVIEAPPPPKNQELHITSVWKADAAPTPTPKIEVLEKTVAVATPVEPPKPVLNPLDIIVDSMEGIDPRALGKLMIELNDKVDLTMVHGDIFTDDVVVKLCSGLGFKLKQLYDASGTIKKEYVGKRKLVGCKAGQKPEFAVVEA